MKQTNPHTKPIIVAIDGLSSCGKSTLAKQLAKTLHYEHIDTGAMYRAITWYMLKNKLNTESLIHHLPSINISFKHDQGKNHVLLNGEDVTTQIRSKEVNAHVSQVSTIPEVRSYLVKQQQLMGKSKGIIMDGRDIGTVVFPHAEVKFFLTANSDIRAKRRQLEYEQKGIIIPFNEILDNLKHRDFTDSTRETSPLKQAPDARIIDTSYLTLEEQYEQALKIILEYLHSHN